MDGERKGGDLLTQVPRKMAIKTVGDISFWLSLSLRLMLSSKFGVRPKTGQKVKLFFPIWTQHSLSPIFSLTDRSAIRCDQSLYWAIAESEVKLNWPVDFPCTRQLSALEINFRWAKITFLLTQK